MTPADIELVKSTFKSVKPIADDAAAMFYGRLFDGSGARVKPLCQGRHEGAGQS